MVSVLPGDRPVLGFDPGRDKCGLAVVDPNGKLLHHEVAPSNQALSRLQDLGDRFAVKVLAIGDRTTSKTWQHRIGQQLPELQIVPVNERNSTLEARQRYWQLYPPRGLSRIIPQGMRVPPRPIDDIVAILLVERYLCQRKLCE